MLGIWGGQAEARGVHIEVVAARVQQLQRAPLRAFLEVHPAAQVVGRRPIRGLREEIVFVGFGRISGGAVSSCRAW